MNHNLGKPATGTPDPGEYTHSSGPSISRFIVFSLLTLPFAMGFALLAIFRSASLWPISGTAMAVFLFTMIWLKAMCLRFGPDGFECSTLSGGTVRTRFSDVRRVWFDLVVGQHGPPVAKFCILADRDKPIFVNLRLFPLTHVACFLAAMAQARLQVEVPTGPGAWHAQHIVKQVMQSWSKQGIVVSPEFWVPLT